MEVYVADNLCAYEVPSLRRCQLRLECVFASVSCSRNKILVGNSYRHPKAQMTDFFRTMYPHF